MVLRQVPTLVGHAISGTWTWFGANAPVVEALATVSAAAIAVVGILVAVADTKNRNSPVVIVEFRRAQDNYFAVALVVKNYGQTPAKKLEVAFDPPLKVEESDGTHGYLVPRRYATPISLLAPGQELSNVWFYHKIGNGNRVVGNRTSLPA